MSFSLYFVLFCLLIYLYKLPKILLRIFVVFYLFWFFIFVRIININFVLFTTIFKGYVRDTVKEKLIIRGQPIFNLAEV